MAFPFHSHCMPKVETGESDRSLAKGWQFACDLSTPSCCLLNHPCQTDMK